ncbi:MAG: hypothetical protein ABW278_03945 [Steroidobacteraceae bacterium]
MERSPTARAYMDGTSLSACSKRSASPWSVQGAGCPRPVVVVVILLGHAALIAMMVKRAGVTPDPQGDDVLTLPIHLMPMTPPAKAIQRGESVQPQRAPSQPVPASVVAPPAPDSNHDAVVTAPPPDWLGEGRRVAEELSRPRAAPRAFGPAPPKPVDIEPPSVFNKPAHHAGEIQVIGQGIERRWLSEHCYMEFGHLPPLFPVPGPRVNPVRCNAGSDEVRGDLFEHLRPKYLKQPGLP